MEKGNWKPEIGKMAWTMFNDPFQVVIAEVFIAAVESSSIGDLYYFAAHGRSFIPPRTIVSLYPTAQAVLESTKVVNSKGETVNA